jgi:hypothetical protein
MQKQFNLTIGITMEISAGIIVKDESCGEPTYL